MTFLKKYHFAALMLALVGLASCHGYIDPTTQTGGTKETLDLSADKTSISADGNDIVSFTAMYGDENVTESRNLVLSYSLNGGEKVAMSAGSSIFATKNAGTYVFTASYAIDDEVVESSGSVTVVATGTQEEQSYGRKVLGMQFTSVGCQNCPILSSYMKEIIKDYAGQVVAASFHTDYGGYADPMSINTTSGIMNKYGIDALPHFALDMNPELQSSAYKDQIEKLISDRLAEPSECGVAISTEFDSADSKLAVNVHLTSLTSRAYRYAVFLIEDGIKYMQMGVEDKNESENYTHNNVVRAMMTMNLNGDSVNGGKELTPGQEVTMTRAIEIRPDWNIDNMRVVAAVLSSDDEKNFTCENVNECRAGGKAGYFTGEPGTDVPGEPGNDGPGNDDPGTDTPDPSAEFVRHLCIMEFTGQWCMFCPAGYKILYDVAASEYSDYRDIAHIIALHDNSSGKDEFAAPLQDVQKDIFSAFGLSAYPSALVDLRKDAAISLSAGNRPLLVEAIEKSLKEYPANCGVAVKSTYDAAKGEVKIDARLFSVKDDIYRITVFVVENGIKAGQNDGGTYREDYTHHYVARDMASQSYKGDSLGEVKAGTEVSKSYTMAVDPSWNVARTEIYVLAIDGNGHVNNVAVCPLNNGETGYDYVENN